MRSWIGIPYLKKWLLEKLGDYEILTKTTISTDELTKIKGKLELLDEILNLLIEYERKV